MADLLIIGNIITMDPARIRADAMLISGERIIFVGSRSDAEALAKPETERLHFPRGAVLPGFIDSHNHMLWTALQHAQLDLNGSKSIREILDRIGGYAAAHPEREWIIAGAGWHIVDIEERRYPTRQEIDAVCAERPVYLPRTGHAAVVNSKALALAGIDRHTQDPPGGKIIRDAQGEPTGLLKEPPAFDLVGNIIPAMDKGRILASLEQVQKTYHAAGLCGIIDPGLTSPELQIYRDLKEQGKMTMRSVVMPLAQVAEAPGLIFQGLSAIDGRTGSGDSLLKYGAVKVYLDGGGASGTALMREPYPDEICNCGIQVTPTDQFRDLVAFCAENRWSLGVHTVGGKAMDIALKTFRDVNARTPIRELRFSLIHAYLWPSPENIADAHALGVGIATQASMQYQSAPLLVERFGEDLVGQATPIRSWMDAGVIVAGGSDSPVTPYPPLLGMWHAMTRYVDRLGKPIGVDQGIDALSALKLYTSNAAWLSFSEHERGALRPGALADWVALDMDPLTIDSSALRDARVLATAVGGRLVHQQ
jgi:predicted amidohydrolase YtcJ